MPHDGNTATINFRYIAVQYNTLLHNISNSGKTIVWLWINKTHQCLVSWGSFGLSSLRFCTEQCIVTDRKILPPTPPPPPPRPPAPRHYSPPKKLNTERNRNLKFIIHLDESIPRVSMLLVATNNVIEKHNSNRSLCVAIVFFDWIVALFDVIKDDVDRRLTPSCAFTEQQPLCLRRACIITPVEDMVVQFSWRFPIINQIAWTSHCVSVETQQNDV